MTWTAADRVRYSRPTPAQLRQCRVGVITGPPLLAAQRTNSVISTVAEFAHVLRTAREWRMYTHTYQFSTSSLLARRTGHIAAMTTPMADLIAKRAQKQYWAPWRYTRPPVLYG